MGSGPCSLLQRKWATEAVWRASEEARRVLKRARWASEPAGRASDGGTRRQFRGTKRGGGQKENNGAFSVYGDAEKKAVERHKRTKILTRSAT